MGKDYDKNKSGPEAFAGSTQTREAVEPEKTERKRGSE